MTFTIQTQSLRQALAAATAVIPSKQTIQILNNILVETVPGSLTLTACNTEQSVTMRIPAETTDTAAFLVNARDLKSIVAAANFDTMVFDLSDTHTLNIGCGFSDYTLPALATDEFPRQSAESEPTAKLTLQSNDLRLALSRVAHAIGTDDLRPQMKGVYFDFAAESFTAVATDTRVLARCSVPFAAETPTSAILPMSAVSMLQGAFLSEPSVDVTFHPNGATFRCGGNEFTTVLIKGKFPDYNRVIPQTYRYEAKFNRKDFTSAVNSASAISNVSGMTRLTFTPGECVVSVSNLDFQQKSTSKCKCDFSGDEMSIFFNLKYLQSVLKSIDAEEIALRMTDSARPGIFVGVSDDSTLNLLMPMQG